MEEFSCSLGYIPTGIGRTPTRAKKGPQQTKSHETSETWKTAGNAGEGHRGGKSAPPPLKKTTDISTKITHRIAALGCFLAGWPRLRASGVRRNVALGILRIA